MEPPKLKAPLCFIYLFKNYFSKKISTLVKASLRGIDLSFASKKAVLYMFLIERFFSSRKKLLLGDPLGVKSSAVLPSRYLIKKMGGNEESGIGFIFLGLRNWPCQPYYVLRTSKGILRYKILLAFLKKVGRASPSSFFAKLRTSSDSLRFQSAINVFFL